MLNDWILSYTHKLPTDSSIHSDSNMPWNAWQAAPVINLPTDSFIKAIMTVWRAASGSFGWYLMIWLHVALQRRWRSSGNAISYQVISKPQRYQTENLGRLVYDNSRAGDVTWNIREWTMRQSWYGFALRSMILEFVASERYNYRKALSQTIDVFGRGYISLMQGPS